MATRQRLTLTEMALLEILQELRPGQIIPVDRLIDRLDLPNVETLRVHVSRLRAKIGKDRIRTEWDLGYRLE